MNINFKWNNGIVIRNFTLTSTSSKYHILKWHSDSIEGLCGVTCVLLSSLSLAPLRYRKSNLQNQLLFDGFLSRFRCFRCCCYLKRDSNTTRLFFSYWRYLHFRFCSLFAFFSVFLPISRTLLTESSFENFYWCIWLICLHLFPTFCLCVVISMYVLLWIAIDPTSAYL